MDEVPEGTERFTLWQLGGCLGCGSLIALSFGLLALTVVRSDTTILSEPAEVEENLQEIVTCQPPPGYRGFRGVRTEGRRIALLAPKTYGDLRIPVTEPLTISVWTFAPDTSFEERRQEVVTYWGEKIGEQLGEQRPDYEERETTIVMRGTRIPAQERVFDGRFRLVVAFVPRTRSGSETMALAFVGPVDGFDTKAMDAFLASIR